MKNEDYVPAGLSTVVPYLTVADAAGLIQFAQHVFGADEVERSVRPDGSIGTAVLKIGNSVIEVSNATATWKPIPAALHIFVPDTDAAYKRAIAAGATSLYEPADMPYGERSGGVADSNGVYWYIATNIGRDNSSSS
ncbi:MAG: VOC family protein [Rhodothermales bacterium]